MSARERRLGLSKRITLAFAVGALAITSIMAASIYVVLQNALMRQMHDTAQAQAFRNAQDIKGPVATALARSAVFDDNTESAIAATVNNRFVTNNASALLVIGERSFSPSGLTREDMPAQLRLLVDGESAGEIIRDRDGKPFYHIGVWISEINAEYYEVVPLVSIEDTLGTLSQVLVAATAVASLLGGAVGLYAARRSLTPLGDVTLAAQSIAGGDFSTRLDPMRDPDLLGFSNAFNEMVDALASRIERDERFASDVSHELRSPLMTLTASVEVLERRTNDLPPQAAQAVTLLSEDLSRFRQLVEDLLEISRIDAGATKLEPSLIVVSQFLRAVIGHSRAPETPLRFDDEDALLTVSGDKRRLGQVITNLIDNAIKYGGGVESIGYHMTTGFNNEALVEIVVVDGGPGVAPQDRDRIFHRFSRAAVHAGSRQTSKGVGLGLALAYEHVRLHEGVLGVRDRRDGEQGAEFFLQLDLVDLDEADDFGEAIW